MNAQEGLAAVTVSADSTPDLAFEESAEGAAAEGAAPEEYEDASPSVVLLVTDPGSVEPIPITIASAKAQLSQILAALNAIGNAEADLPKHLTAIDCMETVIDYLEQCIAADLAETVVLRAIARMEGSL
jgi:hypothetical protein